jgi:diaminopimelate decarboxylase
MMRRHPREREADRRGFFRIPELQGNTFAVKSLPNPFNQKISPTGFGARLRKPSGTRVGPEAGMAGESACSPPRDARPVYAFPGRTARHHLDDITPIDSMKMPAASPSSFSCDTTRTPERGHRQHRKPEEAKYGFTREQIFEGYAKLREKGAKRFGLHTMVASNELSGDYHIETARILFELAAELKAKLGIRIEFVNVGGGAGIPYRPDQKALDIEYVAAGMKKAYDRIVVPAGLDPMGLRMEWARIVTGPYGWLVSTAIHKKEIYRSYIGLDSCMADLMRPGMYGAYHHVSVPGKEVSPATEIYDVVGSLCENNDKFAVQRQLPKIDIGDFVVVHDAGAHGPPWASTTTANCAAENSCSGRTARWSASAGAKPWTTTSRPSIRRLGGVQGLKEHSMISATPASRT